MKTETLSILENDYDVTFYADVDQGDWEKPPWVEITIIKIEKGFEEIEDQEIHQLATDIIIDYQLWKD